MTTDNRTTAEDDSSGYVLYHYDPSMAAAVVFVLVFGASAVLHIYQLSRTRTWYFVPFVLGCLCELLLQQDIMTLYWHFLVEAVGYVGRAMSASETPDWTLKPYIIQSILILLGPALYAASVYMILGRLILLLEAGEYSLIRPNRLTKVFVLGDVLSFFAQGGGKSILSFLHSEKQWQKKFLILNFLRWWNACYSKKSQLC